MKINLSKNSCINQDALSRLKAIQVHSTELITFLAFEAKLRKSLDQGRSEIKYGHLTELCDHITEINGNELAIFDARFKNS